MQQREFWDETIDAKLVPQQRVRQLTVEHAPVPQFREETVEAVKLVSQEREQQRTGEHAPVPQVLEEIVEVEK